MKASQKIAAIVVCSPLLLAAHCSWHKTELTPEQRLEKARKVKEKIEKTCNVIVTVGAIYAVFSGKPIPSAAAAAQGICKKAGEAFEILKKSRQKSAIPLVKDTDPKLITFTYNGVVLTGVVKQ